tara:strand:+ start:484 stop:849 length:366 start_codon:yes stop_codon:yes gene_type:complete
MSKIKGKNTSPEILVRKWLHSNGFRFRLHDRSLPGTPDIILRKHKTIIDVRGCFWHGHKNCRYAVIPKTRTEWWKAKISATMERDAKNQAMLEKDGWRYIIVWECELKKSEIPGKLTDLLV